jgi:hypothetical protein
VIVCFVDIGGIVDHHCLNFLFIGIHMKKKGSVTYDRSVVFSGYSGFPHPKKKNDCHDITEILLKVVLNTMNQT